MTITGSRLRRRWTRLLTAVVAGATLTAVNAPAALAYLGPQTATSPSFVGVNGQHELGTMGLPAYGGQRFVCVDESGGAAGFIDYPHTATAGTDVESWAAAYALSDREGYLQSSDDHKAAALDYYVGVEQGWNSNPSEVTRAWNAAAAAGKWADSSAELATLEADVAAHRGPYTMDQLRPVKSGLTGSVVGIGVQSAASNWEPGYTITLKLTGPAVFTASGTATMTVTSSTAALSEPITFTGAGDVKVAQSTTGLPRYVSLHAAPAAGQQRIVAAGAPSPLTYSDPVSVPSYAPTATSQVDQQLVKPNTPVTDTITVTGGVPNAPWTGTVKVYASLTAHPKGGIPAGATPFTTLTIGGTFDAAGKSTVKSPPVVIPGVGEISYAYFREGVDGTADYPAYEAPLGTETTETVLVLSPDAHTNISSQTSMVGDTISDLVTSGALPTTDLNGDTISYTLSGSIVAGKCGGTFTDAPVFTFGPVPYVSGQNYGSFVVPASAGGKCLSYGEVISFTSPSGSGSVAFAPGQTTETTTVTAPGGRIVAGTPHMVAAGVGLAGPAALLLALVLGVGMAVTRRKGGMKA